MIITLDKLEELKTSTEDIEWFKARYDDKQIELSTLVKDLKASNELGLIWRLLPQLMKNKVTRVKFAVYCAELVLTLYEQKHADGKNPSLAIESTKAWIAKPCEETRKAARCAAKASSVWAAWAAAYYAATSSANAAASASAASWAATSARNATSAASAASWAARKVSPELHAEVVNKIIKYGLQLIEEK